MGNPVYVCPLQGRTALLLIPPFQGLQVNYNAALPIRDPSVQTEKCRRQVSAAPLKRLTRHRPVASVGRFRFTCEWARERKFSVRRNLF